MARFVSTPTLSFSNVAHSIFSSGSDGLDGKTMPRNLDNRA